MLPSVCLPLLVDLTPYLNDLNDLTDGTVVAFDIGPGGNPYLVLAQGRPNNPGSEGQTSGAKTRVGAVAETEPDTAPAYRVLSFKQDTLILDVTIPGVTATGTVLSSIHYVQPV